MKYSYTIALGLSLCGMLAVSRTSWSPWDTAKGLTGIAGINWAESLDRSEEIREPEKAEDTKTDPQALTGGEGTKAPPGNGTAEARPEEGVLEEPAEEEEPVTRETYFDDALFIGDSRTVGLFEYADMGNADVFADSGMSIYKIDKAQFSMKDQEKLGLEQVLSRKQYGKIYLMLGINEMGYDRDQTIRLYGELAARIHSLQPEARMVLEANMHVSESKSARDPLYNNANINAFNEQIRLLAEQEGWTYLDINERFDDASGNLDAQYTADDAHLLGKYYEEWADWIYEKENEIQELHK